MSKRQMIINYVPADECRVAVVENGTLEEFHSERADAVSHVGNIYLGTVVNVEPAIQAAFVDFGLEQAGFLHVSDLHPRYFPGEGDDTKEMVGKKTPRRDRPPIQACLRRGDEIAVQVLKEGVGTKGPTVTSYLSIPGRFLVMMPLMDRVGVSRKVEDEETRRKMREVLDQLDLPEGFGFILRTAGLERTKAELKRDLAYLLRLWKDMERRWKEGSRPRLLYSESDLLVRALRDMLSSEIDRIVVDNEWALRRAASFLKIVAPRSAANLSLYTGRTPIFHAMGIEPQIRNIHSREVPLKSGGRLVIDETEALVAIDVNSGKSREARDAETNAYETNLEAVDEICRQLRLRDLGGIIVNDLIDMRSPKHRREVEARMKENLKKDRARSTVAPISPFGILEMTRQRMRGSQESQHFADCPVCRGRGLVQKPDSVADDATRELATLLEYDRVHRVEMVVSPRLAGELLSTKRRTLNRLERASGKHVDVRVSEAIPVDRVTFYAYDDRGADIDTSRLPAPAVSDDQFRSWKDLAPGGEDWTADPESEAEHAAAQEPAEEPSPEPVAEPMPIDLSTEDIGQVPPPPAADGGRRRRRRRGRGRGRGQAPEEAAPSRDRAGPERREPDRTPATAEAAATSQGEPHGEEAGAADADGTVLAAGDYGPMAEPQSGAPAPAGEGTGRRRRRRRRRRGRGARGEGEAAGDRAATLPAEPAGQPSDNGAPPPPEAPPARERPPISREEFGDVISAGDYGDEEEVAAVSGVDGHGEAGPQGTGTSGGEAGGERRGRRRRRRRRGRGGGGGGAGEAGAPSGGGGGETGARQASPAPSPHRPPQREGRQGGPPRGHDRGPEQAERRSAGPPAQPREPAPSQPSGGAGQGQKGGAPPAAEAAPGVKPAPRPLYAFRRRLSPSERTRLKPE
jgi:ribonuclease E